jgi:hypothetical protein
VWCEGGGGNSYCESKPASWVREGGGDAFDAFAGDARERDDSCAGLQIG